MMILFNDSIFYSYLSLASLLSPHYFILDFIKRERRLITFNIVLEINKNLQIEMIIKKK